MLQNLILFPYDTGSKFACDSVLFTRGIFSAESIRMSGDVVFAFVLIQPPHSKVLLAYDRQCKIKRCPQNGLNAYSVVSYVWLSERFRGQSVHGIFEGIQCLYRSFLTLYDSEAIEYLTAGQ